MHLQTKGSYDFTLQSFDSYSDYMDYTMKERTTKTTVSFGFGIPGIFEFGYNYNNAKYTKSVQKIRRASGTVRYHLCFLFSWALNHLLSPKNKANQTEPPGFMIYTHT